MCSYRPVFTASGEHSWAGQGVLCEPGRSSQQMPWNLQRPPVRVHFRQAVPVAGDAGAWHGRQSAVQVVLELPAAPAAAAAVFAWGGQRRGGWLCGAARQLLHQQGQGVQAQTSLPLQRHSAPAGRLCGLRLLFAGTYRTAGYGEATHWESHLGVRLAAQERICHIW